MTCAQIAPSSSLNSNDTCPLKDVALIPQNLVREVCAVNAQNLTYIGVVPFSGSYRMSDGVDSLIHGRRYREETYREEQVCMFGRAFGACDHLQGPLLLGNDGGCHNLWFIDDDICQTQLAGRVPPRNFVAYAVGGQHKATRWASDGIYLFGIEARGSWPFEFRAYRCKFLVNGNHAGSMEKRKHKGDVSEFDGQSTLAYFAGRFILFTRANRAAEGGYRGVQYALSDDLSEFAPFVQVEFPGIPEDSNLYYAQPYVVGDVLLLVMPIAMTDSSQNISGIYVSVGRYSDGSGLKFGKPELLFRSEVCHDRTIDLNRAGGFASADRFLLLIHRDIPERMSAKMMSANNRRERLEWWWFDIKGTDLFKGLLVY